MAVRSRRLFGPVATGGTTTITLYTVPSGRTAIIRTMTFVNGSSSAAGVLRLSVNNTASTFRILMAEPIPLDGTFIWDHWLALDPGDVLYATSATAASIRCTGFGALLLGAPE